MKFILYKVSILMNSEDHFEVFYAVSLYRFDEWNFALHFGS